MNAKTKAMVVAISVMAVAVLADVVINQGAPTVFGMLSAIVAGVLVGWLLYVGKCKGSSR